MRWIGIPVKSTSRATARPSRGYTHPAPTRVLLEVLDSTANEQGRCTSRHRQCVSGGLEPAEAMWKSAGRKAEARTRSLRLPTVPALPALFRRVTAHRRAYVHPISGDGRHVDPWGIVPARPLVRRPARPDRGNSGRFRVGRVEATSPSGTTGALEPPARPRAGSGCSETSRGNTGEETWWQRDRVEAAPPGQQPGRPGRRRPTGRSAAQWQVVLELPVKNNRRVISFVSALLDAARVGRAARELRGREMVDWLERIERTLGVSPRPLEGLPNGGRVLALVPWIAEHPGRRPLEEIRRNASASQRPEDRSTTSTAPL